MALIGVVCRVVNPLIRTLALLFIGFWFSMPLLAHHWFQESHDINVLVTVEIEVIEFRFINPHPFVTARITNALEEAIDQYGDQDREWELQLDNRWELAELGFNRDTLTEGEKIIVTAHPGSFKKNILYVKAIDHPRLEFRYEHNVRQLLKLE